MRGWRYAPMGMLLTCVQGPVTRRTGNTHAVLRKSRAFVIRHRTGLVPFFL